jgi:hypothetical protein
MGPNARVANILMRAKPTVTDCVQLGGDLVNILRQEWTRPDRTSEAVEGCRKAGPAARHPPAGAPKHGPAGILTPSVALPAIRQAPGTDNRRLRSTPAPRGTLNTVDSPGSGRFVTASRVGSRSPAGLSRSHIRPHCGRDERYKTSRPLFPSAYLFHFLHNLNVDIDHW